MSYALCFSILDQQQKQAIPFQGGVYLGDFDGRIFVASSREIYSLVPIPFEKQVISIFYRFLFKISIYAFYKLIFLDPFCIFIFCCCVNQFNYYQFHYLLENLLLYARLQFTF